MGGLEREAKLALAPEVALPDLRVGPVAEVRPLADQDLDAEYWDTAGGDLLAAGATLRRRTGEAGTARWTLKLPAGAGAPGRLDRRELEVDDPATSPPPSLLAEAAPLAPAPLAPVARLRSARRRLQLLGADGRPLAEVDDDLVSAEVPGRPSQRFREVEVELVEDGDPAVLDAVVAALRAVGAHAGDPRPKLAQALAPAAVAHPDPEAG